MLRLLELREAHGSRSWGNPEAKRPPLQRHQRSQRTFSFGAAAGNSKASCGAGRRDCVDSSRSQMYRTDTRIDFVTHSRSNCYSRACQSKEFRFCLATKVCELLRSITHRGYVCDGSNWRLIWRVPGVGTHSYFRRVRYTGGTPNRTIL